MSSEYKLLSDEQVQVIAAKYYGERAGKTEAQPQPRIALVGAQPGAGKTQASDLVKPELCERGGYIHIDVDRMRERIPIGNAKPTSEQTQPDAGRLVAALRNMAEADRRNFLEEGTFRNAEDVGRFVADKQAQGYQVEMLAVATPREQSLQGIYLRFERQAASGSGNPRMVSEKYHDEALQGFDRTLAKVGPMLDRVRVVDRAGTMLFDSRTSQRGNALEALAEGRKLTDARLKDTADLWVDIRGMAAQRGAPDDYQATLKAHHERIQEMQKDRSHAHAIKQLDANGGALSKDQRYTLHTGAELSKAAYFRGLHEKASEFKGLPTDFKRYDAVAANRQMLKQMPDVAELEGREVVRQRGREEGHSL